jgi:hypothetical protein
MPFVPAQKNKKPTKQKKKNKNNPKTQANKKTNATPQRRHAGPPKVL